MADLDITGHFDAMVDVRMGRGYTAGNTQTEKANYDEINDLKTRLTAISATSYTAARLATMTKNDMQYALRTATADSAGIRYDVDTH